MINTKIEVESEGQMFFHTDVFDAYKLAKEFAGSGGRVATMPEIIQAKAAADEWNPVWTKYLTSNSGEFFGKSKAGNMIVVVSHGIDGILEDEGIMAHSTSDLRENSRIQLTPKKFRELEEGKFGDVIVLDHAKVVGMREYPSSVLSYEDAMEEPLLQARLGSSIGDFLQKHREITQKESGNDYVLTNNHEYMYVNDKNLYAGGLLHIGQLFNVGRCGGESDSISSEVNVSDLSCAGRFVTVLAKGKLGRVEDGLEPILSNLEDNWKKITVPNENNGMDMYTLMKVGDETFAMYEKEGARLDSGRPKFHVVSSEPIGDEAQFKTTIGGYHGFFKYGLDEVQAIAPKDANSYVMGTPQNVSKKGSPVAQVAPIQFYKAQVNTNLRILQPEEIKKDINLVKTLLS